MKDGIIKKLDSFAKKFLKERTKELKKYAKRENELIYNDIVLNLINKLQKENEDITQQRDYYKARYNEFNEAFIKMKS